MQTSRTNIATRSVVGSCTGNCRNENMSASREHRDKAEAMTTKLFCKNNLRRVMSAFAKKILYQTALFVQCKRLKLEEMSVYGSTVPSLLESRAMLNVMFTSLYSHLHHQPNEETLYRILRIVDNYEELVLGEVHMVSITLKAMTYTLNFSVANDALFRLNTEYLQ